MTSQSDRRSRFIGSMLGSALGDAIGELAFRHQREMDLQSEILRAEVLRYTDDTAMAIGLAESILLMRSTLSYAILTHMNSAFSVQS